MDRRALVTSSAFAALLGCGGCGDNLIPTCESVDLIDQDAWEILPMETDPFEPGVGDQIYPCEREEEMGPEIIDGVHTFHVLTGTCNWLTVTQPLLASVSEGDPVHVRVFVFEQYEFPGAAVGRTGIALGDDIVWTEEVLIPSVESGILEAMVDAPRDYAEGSPVRFHVGNHGRNSWNLLPLDAHQGDACETSSPHDAPAP